MMEVVLLALSVGAACVSLLLMVRASSRSAVEVHEDLLAAQDARVEKEAAEAAGRLKIDGERIYLNDEFAAHGLLTDRQRRAFKSGNRIRIVYGALVGVGAGLWIANNPVNFGLMILCGAAVGWLLARNSLKANQRRFFREIEYLLPIVMERLVMAVQAGHDILASVGQVLRVEGEARKHKRVKFVKSYDPVTQLLHVVYSMTESGCSFEAALSYVAQRVESAPLRHAFIHLGIAHREGGELIKPLRELADATQLYFQETVEEEIAKMPIRATMPLVLTFTGLIIFFVTAPISQVSEIAEKAAPRSGSSKTQQQHPRRGL